MNIKRYLLSIAAAAGLFAACDKPEMVQMNIADAVAPVMHDVTVGEAVNEMIITAANQSTKVDFTWDGADFGVKTQINYSVEASIGEGKKFVLLSGITKTEGSQTYEALNQILYADMELVEGELTDVNFFIGAQVGEAQKIYSAPIVIKVSVTAAEKQYPKLSVAGSYNGWVHNTQYLFDFAGDDKVYQAVIDFGEDHAKNEFKITGGGWGNDEHSMASAHDPESKTIALVAGGGDNINVYQAKRYYHLTFNRALTLTADVSFDQVGVLGGFNGWSGDVVMTFNPAKQRFYADVEFAEDTEFKFRLDGEWTVSYGSSTPGILDSADNIKASAGNYRIYLNMNNIEEMTFELNAKMYGKDEPVGGATEPEPEPEPAPVVGWGLVGAFSGWGENPDVMLASDGTYLVVKGVELEGELKFRKDGGWDVNLGLAEGASFAADTEIALAAGGPNLVVTAGTYDVYLDEENSKAWFITDGSYPGGGAAPEASEWGVVGAVNGWAAPDITMYKTATEGLFVAYKVEMPDGGFKIRANGEWNDAANYGLETSGDVEVDHCYDVITGGGSGNMNLTAGTYDIWFDLTNTKVYIMTPGKPISEAEGGEAVAPAPEDKVWHMVGNFNNWNPGDEAYKMTLEGDFYVFKNFTAEEGCEAKFAPGEWNGDKGGDGTFAVNTACPTGSDNILVEAGTYDVYLAKDLSVYYFMEVGKTPVVEKTWYMVGNFNNWNPGDESYKMTSEGDFYVFKNFTAEEGCEAKFAPGEWNGDKGGDGTFAADTACTTGSSNIAVAAGTYDVYLKKDLTVYYFMTPGTTPEN